MSKSTANTKRRRKHSKTRQQARVHGAERITVRNEQHRESSMTPQHEVRASKQSGKATSLAPLANSITRHDPGQDWKPALQQYITTCNQLEIAQYGGRLSEYTDDQLHNNRAEERLRRLRERDLARGIKVAGSEMKAELISVNEVEREVIINVKFHLSRKLAQAGRQYVEERVDQERLWLQQEGGKWQIVRVEPIIAERNSRQAGVAMGKLIQQDDAADEEPSVARPYLNPDMLSGFRYIRATTRYMRDEAVAYADKYWNKPNPSYEEFEANCTNYVSQCLFAGKAPMLYTNRRDSGWWYKGRGSKGKEWWSYSWSVSRSLAAFLSKARGSGLRAEEVESADRLQLGDLVFYDWNGNNSYQHTTIVTAFDSNGQPLVNANTNASRHRYWDYQDSYAWTPNTRYRFFHISEMM